MKGSSSVRTNGFTLIEMLTVVAIFGLVAIYVGRVLTVNERAYHTVENTSESQQNLRVFGELIENDLRHAGLMVPRDGAVCGVDQRARILYVSDGGAIDPQRLHPTRARRSPAAGTTKHVRHGDPHARLAVSSRRRPPGPLTTRTTTAPRTATSA
jgi:prepilin-type N-terminal cleavage/methylation domain-containing protein